MQTATRPAPCQRKSWGLYLHNRDMGHQTFSLTHWAELEPWASVQELVSRQRSPVENYPGFDCCKQARKRCYQKHDWPCKKLMHINCLHSPGCAEEVPELCPRFLTMTWRFRRCNGISSRWFVLLWNDAEISVLQTLGNFRRVSGSDQIRDTCLQRSTGLLYGRIVVDLHKPAPQH